MKSDDIDQFRDDSSSESGFVYGIGGGYSLELDNQNRLDIGLGWYGDADHDYKGYIDQYGDSSLMRDYSYEYKVQSQRLMLESAWYFPMYPQFEGFLTGGIGIGWNKFKDYHSTRLDPRDASPKPGVDGNEGVWRQHNQWFCMAIRPRSELDFCSKMDGYCRLFVRQQWQG